jgi:ribosomal protein L37E
MNASERECRKCRSATMPTPAETCSLCGYEFPIGNGQRVRLTYDPDTFKETFADMVMVHTGLRLFLH